MKRLSRPLIVLSLLSLGILFCHQDVNAGDKPIEVMVVELKKAR